MGKFNERAEIIYDFKPESVKETYLNIAQLRVYKLRKPHLSEKRILENLNDFYSTLLTECDKLYMADRNNLAVYKMYNYFQDHAHRIRKIINELQE